MTFLETALSCVRRGWHVFPLVPRGKFPRIKKADGGKGFKDATLDIFVIAAWWTDTPLANVGIACGASNLFVVDIDNGFETYLDFQAWRQRNGIPQTFAVHTGRRKSYAVQMYFAGAMENNGAWELDGAKGEIRSIGGYVMAVGNVHPDTGEQYELIVDVPLAPRPAIFEQAGRVERVVTPGEPIVKLGKGEGRTPLMMSKLGLYHRMGLTEEAALAAIATLNDTHFSDPIPLSKMEETVRSCWAKWEVPVKVPSVSLGGRLLPVSDAELAEAMAEPAEPVDWRTHYHSFEEMRDAPPPKFLIEGFLLQDTITAIAAPVGQRKSLIALNVAHALCTNEPLFGYFKVTNPATRVLYICPEMGIRSFTDRVRKIGLMEHVGKTLFCRTMALDKLPLADITAEELAGAVLIIDTAVRYLTGDENSSEHMRVFADEIFRLMKDGAIAVLLLHHSLKGTKESAELTLENVMRGSGELGAFLSSCWGTRLQDGGDPYESKSFIANVKQREFESRPFEVYSENIKGTYTGRLLMSGEPGKGVTLNSKPTGVKADKDGREEDAIEIIRQHPDATLRDLSLMLKDAGIKRGKDWVGNKRFELFNRGVKTS